MKSKTQKALDRMFARARRSDVNLSALSRESGLTRVTLSNWRNGRGKPTLEAYLDVMEALSRLEKAFKEKAASGEDEPEAACAEA